MHSLWSSPPRTSTPPPICDAGGNRVSIEMQPNCKDEETRCNLSNTGRCGIARKELQGLRTKSRTPGGGSGGWGVNSPLRVRPFLGPSQPVRGLCSAASGQIWDIDALVPWCLRIRGLGPERRHWRSWPYILWVVRPSWNHGLHVSSCFCLSLNITPCRVRFSCSDF